MNVTPAIPIEKADALAVLRKEILVLQSRPALHPGHASVDLGPIGRAFPNGTFPTGALHELCSVTLEEANASSGFTAGILSSVMKGGGACVWASAKRSPFPHGLAGYGIDPHNIIFITPRNEKQLLWTVEEALKCHGLAAVVGEVQSMGFMASRRLQLAVEESRVTGFVLRRNMQNMEATACAARWRISPLPTALEGGMPGIGFPRWKVELLKVRNGKLGTWQVEWNGGEFRTVTETATVVEYQRRAV